jgi:hypothetical protein
VQPHLPAEKFDVMARSRQSHRERLLQMRINRCATLAWVLVITALFASCGSDPAISELDRSDIATAVGQTTSIKERGDAEAYFSLLTPTVRGACSVDHIQRIFELENSVGRAFAPGVLPAPGQELEILSSDVNRALVLPPQVAPAIVQLQNTAVRVERTAEGWRIDLDERLVDSCRDGIVSSDRILDAFLAGYGMIASATVTRANFADDFDRVPVGFEDEYAAAFAAEFRAACSYDPFLQLVIRPGFDDILGLNDESKEENWKASESADRVDFFKRESGAHVMTLEWNGSRWEITRFLDHDSC